MNITEDLSKFAVGLELADLSPAVVQRTKYLMLDAIGNAIRARHGAESTPALISAVQAMGMGHGSARVFGDKQGYSPVGATLINATLIHSLDFDDTHAAAIVHPAAPIIPAALAAAEAANASGADVIAAIVAGYEVALRLALALPAGAHYGRGFHPTATCGVFGATAAAARIFRLSAAQLASAFGIALSQSAGSLQFLANGAWTKRFQVGWAGMSGYAAACLAREGFKGAAQPFEGKHGFLNAYSPTPDPARAVQDLGRIWELMQTGIKPYPSCRWGHAGIDAALALRTEQNLKPETIEAVTLGLSRAGMLLIGEPAEKKANPQNIVDAQFSAPFVLAMALSTGAMDWGSYDKLGEPTLRTLMSRIHCENDPDIEAEFPANMSGRLTVHAAGRIYVKTVIIPKGEPENFLSEAELTAKFYGLTQQLLGKTKAASLADATLTCERLNNIVPLFTDSVR